MRSTHTYVELEVSPAAYEEIAGKLRAAGYGHVFGSDGEIDMHGLALTKEAVAVAPGTVTVTARTPPDKVAYGGWSPNKCL